MDLQLEGRRALVTGSSSGIGTCIARMLAQEGCRVVVHGRNRERAETTAREIGAAGVAIGDLSTDEGADAVFADAVKALGGDVEILVNNAGGTNGTGTTSRPPLDVTVPEWMFTYQNNTLAMVRMILRVAPGMKAAGFGRLIQISSAVAVHPNPLGPDYSGAKAAINNLTVTLAASLKGAGITVNTVSPGLVATPPMLIWGRRIAEERGWGEMDTDQLLRRLALDVFDLPAGRIGVEEDIGMVVNLLASPRSGYVTASNYRVDGGWVRSV